MPTSQTTDKIFEKELFLLEKFVPGEILETLKFSQEENRITIKGLKKPFLVAFKN